MPTTDDARSESYRDILRLARRFAHSDDAARDLAQDALTIALQRGFADWDSPERRGWLFGVLRRRAAFVSRTEVRRVRREQMVDEPPGDTKATLAWRPSFLAKLPASLRVVATLASADLCAEEVRWLLRLTPEALRTRLSALRKAVRAEAEPPTQEGNAPQAQQGPRRSVLLAALKITGLPMVAAHDPDGHAIFFRAVAHEKQQRGNP